MTTDTSHRGDMRRISSGMTFFYKRIFPFLWFGFLLVFIVVSLLAGPQPDAASALPFLIGPLAMAFVGYLIFKKLIFDLVDEVFDEGDSLLVRNGTQQEHIALSDIMNVNYSPLVSPPRVTLSLRRPSSFGDKITFCAPVRFIPFATSPVIDDLIQRVDAARRKR
jgi:hypothetical protein